MFICQSESLKEASENSGVPLRTLKRWYYENKAFKKQLQKYIRELTDLAQSNLAAAQTKTIKVLLNIIEDDDEKSMVRVSAARAILDNAIKYRAEDVREQLKELECRLQQIETTQK